MKAFRAATLLALSLILVGCGARAASTPPQPVTDDQRVVAALAMQTWGAEQMATLAELDSVRGAGWVNSVLRIVVRDTLAPLDARVNALLQLGERGFVDDFGVYHTAARADQPLLRSAAMVAAGSLLLAEEVEATAVLRHGLRDTTTLVQAKALQSLADTDATLLRRFIASNPPPQPLSVAQDLLRVAEERGVPLADSSALVASGDLARTTGTGHRIEFRARRHWPQWQAAAGELWVGVSGAPPTRVADDVEMVAGVIPAFVSSDGRYLVYEAARTIRVRELASGADRVVGPGIAPRLIPFSNRFVYLVEQPAQRAESSDGTRLRYTVLAAALDTNQPATQLGSTNASARTRVHGAYSPVRWMRVRERQGVFMLEGRNVDPIRLPDPFGTTN